MIWLYDFGIAIRRITVVWTQDKGAMFHTHAIWNQGDSGVMNFQAGKEPHLVSLALAMGHFGQAKVFITDLSAYCQGSMSLVRIKWTPQFYHPRRRTVPSAHHSYSMPFENKMVAVLQYIPCLRQSQSIHSTCTYCFGQKKIWKKYMYMYIYRPIKHECTIVHRMYFHKIMSWTLTTNKAILKINCFACCEKFVVWSLMILN